MNKPIMLLAGCAVFDDAGRLLAIHRQTPELTQWEVPGGKIEPGEDPQVAAVREIKEELGITVEVAKALGVTHFDFHGTPCEYHYFQAGIVAGRPSPQEAKHTECAYIDLDATDRHLSRGIKGLKRVLHGEA